MVKNKLLLLSTILVLSITQVFAEELSEITHPKPPAYRLGISAYPEKQFIQAQQEKLSPKKEYAKLDNSQESSIADRTYADLSIKNLSKEIAQELEFDEQNMISDLSLLWQGAAQQSDTINFALYKLANPDADKPNEKSVKNVLKTIASMSTIVGASMGNPLLAGSSLLGGNIFGIMSQDTKALNYKYTRVTDADMIILIRKIEDLQQNAVNLYYDYISAKKQLDLANNLVADRKHKFELAQTNNAQRELVVITDAYYRTALDKQRCAKSEFFSKRAALEQFVGTETFLQFESEYIARENGETTPQNTSSKENSVDNTTSENTEYNETIKNVENFTKDLQNKANSEENVNKISDDPQTLPQYNNFEFPFIDEPTGLAASIQDIFGFQKELNNKEEQKELKKAKKEQERLAKQAEKEKRKQEKILSKQEKETLDSINQYETKSVDKIKTKSEKQLKKQINKEEKARIKAEKKLAKQAKKQAEKEAKELKKLQQIEKQSVENSKKALTKEKSQDHITTKVEKKTRAQIREEKKEAKRLAKEKEIQEKEARKKKGPLKGIIFLHGQDKSLYKHHHYFSEPIQTEQPVAKKDKPKKEKSATVNSIDTTSSQSSTPEIEPITTVAPTTKPTSSELMNLPPLDAIRAPELTRGGYSIHSDY
ncbi:MAG: hypothetical protein E7Z87_05125 [Cyanobacteria bacterium SIG26]|nr:hypothetical protein [Cyanobacteria bacterium SIG26]